MYERMRGGPKKSHRTSFTASLSRKLYLLGHSELAPAQDLPRVFILNQLSVQSDIHHIGAVGPESPLCVMPSLQVVSHRYRLWLGHTGQFYGALGLL